MSSNHAPERIECASNIIDINILYQGSIKMFNIDPLFAYFSPETLLPVGSILATVLGVADDVGARLVAVFDPSLQRVRFGLPPGSQE